jgi:hypothetical protein
VSTSGGKEMARGINREDTLAVLMERKGKARRGSGREKRKKQKRKSFKKDRG